MRNNKDKSIEAEGKVEATKTPLVVTLVDTGGPVHPLVSLFSKAEPEYKMVGLMGVPGTNTFSSLVATLKGDKVIKIEVGTPNLRRIAESEAKIEFVNLFMADEIFQGEH